MKNWKVEIKDALLQLYMKDVLGVNCTFIAFRMGYPFIIYRRETASVFCLSFLISNLVRKTAELTSKEK